MRAAIPITTLVSLALCGAARADNLLVGLGATQCSEVKGMSHKQLSRLNQWVLGYFSGVSAAHGEHVDRRLKSFSTLADEVRNICQQQPSLSIEHAAELVYHSERRND